MLYDSERSNKMKRMIFFNLLFIFILTACVTGNKTIKTTEGPANIIPGKGIASVQLGMSLNSITRIIGRPSIIRNFKEAKTNFIDFGIDPKDYIMFMRGFNLEAEYSLDQKAQYPIFKLYFKDDLLVYIILTSYGFEENRETILQYKTWHNISFWTEEYKLKEKFGNNYLLKPYENYKGKYYYLDLGISFLIDKEVIRTIDIFPPLTEEEKKRFQSK
jgi:hypothetical protein